MTVARVPEVFLDHVGNDFGISLGGETVPFFSELLLQGNVVFDDAVVDDNDLSRAVAVRMRILFSGAPMRGPASVAYAIGAVERLKPDDLFQVSQLSFGAADLQAVSIPANGDARRVVAAILQPPEAVKNDWD